jgi:hypothetical protein
LLGCGNKRSRNIPATGPKTPRALLTLLIDEIVESVKIEAISCVLELTTSNISTTSCYNEELKRRVETINRQSILLLISII